MSPMAQGATIAGTRSDLGEDVHLEDIVDLWWISSDLKQIYSFF